MTFKYNGFLLIAVKPHKSGSSQIFYLYFSNCKFIFIKKNEIKNAINNNFKILNIIHNMTTYTYTRGFNVKCEKNITKNDIVNMCKSLNNKDEYLNVCEIKPEGITEGGFVYNFKDGNNNRWYKSVRFQKNGGDTREKWPWINENVMDEWAENNDIIFNENYKFTIFLKSRRGAPLFTIDELKIWEECFNQIGIIKVGKYPSKKSLISKK